MIVRQQHPDQGVAVARWWRQALRRNRGGGSGLWCRHRRPGRARRRRWGWDGWGL